MWVVSRTIVTYNMRKNVKMSFFVELIAPWHGEPVNPSNDQPIVKIYYMLPQKLTIHQLWNMTRQVSQTHNDMTTIPSLIIHTLMCLGMYCSNSNLLLRGRFLLVRSKYSAIHANTWILVRTVSKPWNVCILDHHTIFDQKWIQNISSKGDSEDKTIRWVVCTNIQIE